MAEDRPRSEKVRHWRDRAEHYRRLALKARSRQTRDAYQDLARNCDDVAQRLERTADLH